MRLPIAAFYKDKIYTDVELCKPSGELLADTKEAFDGKTEFHGIHVLVSGGIGVITALDGSEETSRSVISSIVRHMPYRSAEYVGIQIMAKLNGDDKIDSVYQCPRCDKQILPEISEDYDDRMKVSEIEILRQEEPIETFDIQLGDPVEIKAVNGDIIVGPIENFKVRYPILNDCISAAMTVPSGKTIRRQYAIYAAAIREVNGEAVDDKLRRTWGVKIFEKMDLEDIRKFGRAMKMYGLKGTIHKVCPKCSHEWEAFVDTSGFFASGLQSD